MKELFISSSFNFINNHKNLSEYEKIKIKYGLEVMYHFITKTSFVLLISLIFNIFWETILTFFLFGILRTFCHGIHAKSNLLCWILTLSTYIINGICCKLIQFNIPLKITIIVITSIHIILFSPSDTIYRPIRKKEHRIKLKTNSILICILYDILTLKLNNIISRCLLSSLILISISISPLTYKVLKMSRNNYKVPT